MGVEKKRDATPPHLNTTRNTMKLTNCCNPKINSPGCYRCIENKSEGLPAPYIIYSDKYISQRPKHVATRIKYILIRTRYSAQNKGRYKLDL